MWLCTRRLTQGKQAISAAKKEVPSAAKKEQAISASHEVQASSATKQQGSKLIVIPSRKPSLQDTPIYHPQSDAPLAGTHQLPSFLSSGSLIHRVSETLLSIKCLHMTSNNVFVGLMYYLLNVLIKVINYFTSKVVCIFATFFSKS
ncbi:transmembrane protein, putative [Medicago truncatula]|uniref:Transmembrane protein, putative n=1 Tax=Medicago truncatula TaxID=3880 RepID=G7JF56_MEDTR|nr:transmembrane protein, putative [Medicago truncatula]